MTPILVDDPVERAGYWQDNSGLLVGIDIDGVIADIVGQLVKYAMDLWGYSIDARDLTSENVDTCTELSTTQVRHMFSTPSFFRTMSILPLAKESLDKLVQSGLGIVLVTDRFWYPRIQTDTLDWLRCNNIPFRSIHFATRSDKAGLTAQLGIRFFIEDQLSNANLLSEVCTRVFLVDRPYNQGPTSASVLRVASLEEAVRKLCDSVSARRACQEDAARLL